MEEQAARQAAGRGSFGLFGSLFGGGAGGAVTSTSRPLLSPLPSIEQRKTYMVEVMRKCLEALGKLHKCDVAHRSLGADSILMTSTKAGDDLRQVRMVQVESSIF